MSRSPSEIFSDHDIFPLIINCLDDRDVMNFGRITKGNYARLVASSRYKEMKRTSEVATQYPTQYFPIVYQQLLIEYTLGIGNGFSGPLKRYSQSDAMKEMAKSALACFESVHELASRCTRNPEHRVQVVRNIESIMALLAQVLPNSRFTLSTCDDQLKDIQTLPHTQSLVRALHDVFVNEALLSLAEQAIFKNLCSKPQSSIFCDIYALLDSLEKYYGVLNHPTKPFNSFYESSYVQYHGKVKTAVRKLQQGDVVSHAMANPRYIVPFVGLLIGLIVYMYYHPIRGRGTSYAGLTVAISAALGIGILMGVGVYKNNNKATLRELAAIPLSEIRKTEEESSEEETESPRP